MVIINKNKPFYIDEKNKVIRMGNFTGTGKEITYDDESFLSIFNNIQQPISVNNLINKVYEETYVSKDDIKSAIDYLISENFIIKYDKYKNLIANNKYNRQDLFFSMFNDNYESYNKYFKNKNILILGLGGIGSNVAIVLERAGFNSFTLVDCDIVEETNLIRQIPYNFCDIGKLKTEVIKEKLKSNKIKCKNVKIASKKDIIEEIKSSDFVLCTVDKPQRIIRRLINKLCVENSKPVLFCGFSEYVAMIGPFIEPKKTACLNCIEKQSSEVPINNVELVPSFGPLCLLISSLVSNEIINYFSKYKETSLIGKTLMFDMLTYQTNIIDWKKNLNVRSVEWMQVNNLKAGFESTEVLKDINFCLSQGDKVGLVGPNGSGKSTLLKVLAKELPLTSGKINLESENISYLKQEISHEFDNYSIIDYIKNQTGIGKLEDRISELEKNLTSDNMNEYGDVLDRFMLLDGYSFESNLQNIMRGLKLNKNLDNKISNLSGGEKIKVLLCAMILNNGDILLLDEPTNNLDIEAINWLENYLKNSQKSIIMVSHDEAFLNNIVSKIFEMSDGKIKEYNLGYNDYLKQKDIEYEQNKSSYINRLEERKKIKDRLQKAKEWSNKGTSSKAHNDNDKIANNFAKEKTRSSEVSKLSKTLEKLDIPTFQERKKINFFLDLDNEKGNKNIYVDNLICGYEDFQTVPLKLNIYFGDKISIQGSNGSGKTTFIKTLLGLVKPIDGNITIGNDVKIGYISQDTIISDKNISVYDFIIDHLDEVEHSLVFTLLNNFGFNYEDRNKKYFELSPGQRTRVNLAKIALHKINVLILDEITNHLDKEALDLIYELIESYPGTIISISHNRKYNEILNADYILDITTGNIEYLQDDNKKKLNIKRK